MNHLVNKKTGLRQKLILLLKILVSIACLWYVFTKVDFKTAWQSVKEANWSWLAVTFLIYMFSKYLGAKRLNIYFENIGINLPKKENVKLYWIGMFYNLFLPGAITGDAYKVVVLSKRYKAAYKKLAAAVLLDRFSGLLSLGLILAGYSAFVITESWIVLILVTGSLLAIPVLYVVVKKLFPDFLPGFWPTFFWGALVQLGMLACVYFILFAMHVDADLPIYVFIFLVAVAASVLPISVGGGLGVREFVIIEGAKYAGLGESGQHTALILSLLFYLVTLLASIPGLLYVYNNPFEKKYTPD